MEVDINNKHMGRIRVNMLVIIRYAFPLFDILLVPPIPRHAQLYHNPSTSLKEGGVVPSYRFERPLTFSNNPKPPLLPRPPLLVLHPHRDQMLGPNMLRTGPHTDTTLMIPNVSFRLRFDSWSVELIVSPSLAGNSGSTRRTACYFIISSVSIVLESVR